MNFVKLIIIFETVNFDKSAVSTFIKFKISKYTLKCKTRNFAVSTFENF